MERFNFILHQNGRSVIVRRHQHNDLIHLVRIELSSLVNYILNFEYLLCMPFALKDNIHRYAAFQHLSSEIRDICI